MYQENNIILFPKTSNHKLQEAIDSFSHNSAKVSLEKFINLVDDGLAESYAFVGAIYELGGRGVEKDYEKARFYYERSVEEFGAVEAYLGLARIYSNGLGVEKDCCKAFEYYRLVSEEKNNMFSNFMVGKMYMEGVCVERDLNRAKELFKKSWDSGYVFGLTYLGLLEQMMGNGVKGWFYRIKAGSIAYFIARKNIDSPRIREI